MSSSNHGHSKSSRNRNRLSLFLFLSSSRKPSSSSSSAMPCSPTSSFTSHMPTSPTASVAAYSLAPPSSIAPSSIIHMNTGAPILNEAVPPTTNELDAKEKARLLKKARKLSRVFGDDPSLSYAAVPVRPMRSSYSLHQGSTSSLAASNETHSSGRRPLRKSPSFPELKATPSESSGLPQINETIPPLPTADQLQRKIVTPSSAPASLSHEELTELALSISTTSLKPLQDDEVSIHSITPTTPTFPSAEQSRRARMAKLRRFLGEDNIPPQLVSQPLRSRKSYDSSLATLASRNSLRTQAKLIKRSQSLARRTHREGGEAVEDAVDFHRRYVQTFGRMGHRHNRRRTHASAIAEAFEAVESLPSQTQPPEVNVDKTLPKSRSTTSIGSVSTAGTEGRPSTVSSHPSSKHPSASDVIPSSPSSGSIHSTDYDSGLDTSFRDRRRRAAKLAQFFGVEYQDISASLPTPNVLSSSGSTSPGVHVDIKMNNKKFWGFHDGRGTGTLRDADMVDVIDKLRDLRAS